MENPFVKLVGEGEDYFDDKSKLTPIIEPMTSSEKKERLTQLQAWLKEAQSIEEEDRIKEEIYRLQQE